MALTRSKIIEILRTKMDCPREVAKDVMRNILETVRENLEKGNDVKIAEFGKWSVKKKQSRCGRNPKSGKPLEISPRQIISFSPSDKFLEVIKGVSQNGKE